MTIDLVLLLIIIAFSFIINILFFVKKHVDTKETRLYGVISLVNLIGLIMEFVSIYTVRVLGTESLLSVVVNKGYYVYLLVFLLLFSLYVVNIAELSNSKFDVFYEKMYKIIRIALYVVFSISLLGVCLLDINLSGGSELIYASGSAVNLVYNVYIVSIFCFIIYIIRNIDDLKKNGRNIPIIIFIIMGIISIYLLNNNPGMIFHAVYEFIIVFLMYHTIDNPDVKLLEKLEIAKQEVNEANRAKTDFLSSMSHEIRTPLNSIVGFSDCLLDSDNIDDIKNNAHDIVNASESLLEVINGILDVSKIEAGNIEIKSSAYNSFEVFKSVADLISPKMMGKGLDFSFSIAPDVPKTLYGDSTNIKKIISNLLTNAYKYTDNGFVKYDIKCVNVGDYVKLIISVEDSGIGIKREDLDKLFVKFQRLDVAKNETSDGTGLGLAVIKQLAELMGGKVIVYSEYGKGTKFTVLINQYIVKEDISSERQFKKMLDLTNVKILLVDDNNLNLKVSTKILEKYNANSITKCGSGFECLDLIRNGNKYDVILLDDMMPKMSGVETLAELRKIEGFNTPVIALTANAILGMKDKYIEAGFDDYLAKPINKNILIEVMNKVLINSVSENNPDIKTLDSDSTKKYQGVIPVDDNFIYKVSNNMMDLSYDNQELDNTNPTTSELDTSQEVDVNSVVQEVEASTTAEDETNSSTSEVLTGEDYLRNNGVDLDKALELLGDMEMYNSTVSDFLDEVDDKWNRIVEYKNSSDMKNYAIEVHSLKSDSKYLGLMELADVAYQHELKSKENDTEYVNNHFSELEQAYNKWIDIIKKYNK